MAYNSAYTGPQVDAAVGAVQGKETTWDGKQDKLTGQSGQVVGFDAEGNAIAQTPPETGDVKADGSVPMTGDLNMGGHRITNVSAPTQPTDAVRQSDLKTVSDEVDGIISGATPIILPPATTTKIGGVIVGDGIDVEANGTISTNPVPAGGSEGQVLTKTSTGEEWSDAPSGLPEGGTEGQILEKTSSGAAWVDAPESGLTQSEADERYLQLSGGTIEVDALSTALTLKNTTSTGLVSDVNRSPYLNFETGNGKVVNEYINFGSGRAEVAFYDVENDDFVAITGLLDPVAGADAANKAYVDSKAPTSVTVTLTTSGWSSNTQTVTVSGVSASETAQLITPTPAILSQSAYYEAGIMCTNQGTNSLTFTCQTVPTSNLTVYVVIQPLS